MPRRGEPLPAVRGEAERNELAERNLALAGWAAARCRRRRGELELADLRQVAAVQLLRACSLFDPARGVKFSAYAARDMLRRCHAAAAAGGVIRLPHHLQGDERASAAARARATRLGGREPAAPGRDAELAELRDCLGAALARLGERDRAVVLMRAEGLTLREAGERLGLTRERVRQIQARGLKALRADRALSEALG